MWIMFSSWTSILAGLPFSDAIGISLGFAIAIMVQLGSGGEEAMARLHIDG